MYLRPIVTPFPKQQRVMRSYQVWYLLVNVLRWWAKFSRANCTWLFKMIVGVLTACHTQYTRDSSICIFLFNGTTLQFFLHTLQVFYMCTLCDSTNINTVIEFVPNCLQHVSGDGFSVGSDSYLQFRDTCRKRRNVILILDVTPQKKITWGYIWSTRLLKPPQSF